MHPSKNLSNSTSKASGSDQQDPIKFESSEAGKLDNAAAQSAVNPTQSDTPDSNAGASELSQTSISSGSGNPAASPATTAPQPVQTANPQQAGSTSSNYQPTASSAAGLPPLIVKTSDGVSKLINGLLR